MTTPNTLTNLQGTVYSVVDNVSRGSYGAVAAVSINAADEQLQLGQSLRIPVTTTESAITPSAGQLPNDGGETTVSNRTLTLANDRAVQIQFNMEEMKGLNKAGPGYNPIFADRLSQSFETLLDEMSQDVCDLYDEASVAIEPAGTNLFDSTGHIQDSANVKRELRLNKARLNDLQMIVSPTIEARLNALKELYQVNTSGQAETLREAATGRLHGFDIHVDNNVKTHTKGTASTATTDNAGYAVGATTITLGSAGTGTILEGDIITFAGDSAKYTVRSGDANVSDGGTITIAEPGLRQAIAASTTAITVESGAGAVERCMAFDRQAIQMIARGHAGLGEDSAVAAQVVTDPVSGLPFTLVEYPQYRQKVFELGALWGVGMTKQEHAVQMTDAK